MTLNINERKYRLIERIMRMKSERQLDLVEAYLSNVDEVEFREKVKEASKPIPKDKTLEKIKKEQKHKMIDFDEFDILAEKLDIQEPIEELLATLD